jgi:hypothetical protein
MRHFVLRVRCRPIALLALIGCCQGWIVAASGRERPQQSDQDAIRQLSQQIIELQAKMKELEARLEAKTQPAEPHEGTRSPTPSAPTPTGVAESLAVAISQEEEGKNIPSVKLRMFGDVGYEVSDQKGKTNSFHIGSLDLFMTGALSDRVSILGEVLFIPQHDNSIGLDVERLLVQYKHNDYFTLAVGRYHSSIGYYNTAFHQGAWFQTAVDRPFMYAFDDRGGFLPLQEVGITISGQLPSGKLGLNYVVEVGNGRNHLLGFDPAQNTQDTNNGKSFNLALFARPNWVPGLQMGFSIYHDRLTFSDNINHDELISTVHIIYKNSNYEFLNEGLLVRHTGTKLGFRGTFHTPGFYTQISHRFGKYRPYFRYAYLNAGVSEPIYGDPADGPVVGRHNGPSLGLRYDFNDHAAVKLEYDRIGHAGQRSSNALETQLSFAF